MTSELSRKLRCLAFLEAIAIFILTTAWARDIAYPVLELEYFSLSQLKNPDAQDIKRLKYAVFEVGMFAVTDFPPTASSPPHTSTESHDLSSPLASEDEPFHGALHAYALCTQAGLADSEIHTTELADSTLRRTLALSTNRSIMQPMPTRVMESCPVFTESAKKLREDVDLAGRAYARVLDRLVHGLAASEPATPASGVIGDSFVSAVIRSESLEHFHLFQRQAPPSNQPSLDMHSDMGLFIIMTAAEYFSSLNTDKGDGSRLAPGHGKPEPGLLIELPSGMVVRPNIADGSLLVMNGEGANMWMRAEGTRASDDPPYAPPHELVVPDVQGATRAWFGRMYLPPRDAVLQHGASKGITFNEYREQTYEAFKEGRPCEASTAGCPPSRRALSDDGACGAGQVYCWMQCMSISGLGCSQNDTICIDPSGDLWPQDFPQGTSTHCPTCSLQCAGAPPLPAVTGFCDTRLSPVTMWMTGLQFSGTSSDACVVYLFKEWTLDTNVKFAFACIGTFLMGVVVIALGGVRQFFWRQHEGVPNTSSLHNRGLIAGVTFTYMVQLTLSYCVMLFVMTYQAELFIMSVLGLVTGHFYFDIYRRWGVLPSCHLTDIAVMDKSVLISLNSERSSPSSISPQRSCCRGAKDELSSKSDGSSGSDTGHVVPEVPLEGSHMEVSNVKEELVKGM